MPSEYLFPDSPFRITFRYGYFRDFSLHQRDLIAKKHLGFRALCEIVMKPGKPISIFMSFLL
jgi:hypothetical protein